MLHNNLSPLGVVKYDADYIVEFVRYKTGWDQRSEVTQKIQLKYLCEYLEIDHINAKTIVVEDEYIDRHYLEDYSEYYARCFPAHPRKCSRLHFFSSVFDESELISAISKNERLFLENLQNTYIGFVVIRPIPHTFLARVCIKPYAALLKKEDGYKIILKKNNVNLFGIPLTVSTTAFLEQDKVVSACATSAIWTLLSATPQISVENLPSPSAITKSGAHTQFDGSRTFPTSGMTQSQISRCLKHYGLEPTVIPCSEKRLFSDLKESIYSYLSNDIPILIGGDVYEKKGNENKYLGKHLVCAVGFRTEKFKAFQTKPSTGKMASVFTRVASRLPLFKQRFVNNQNSQNLPTLNMQSHSIDRLYVHDDRFGPFVKVDMKLHEFSSSNQGSKQGMIIKIKDHLENYFVPDFALVGLYHKVRITYQYISAICSAFFDYLAAEKSILEPQGHEFLNALNSMLVNPWHITLTTSSAIKEELISEENFFSYNGSPEKTDFLVSNIPKYIWRCRIDYDEADHMKKNTDLFFDATEVPQGKVFMGYISYTPDSETIWKYIEARITDREWHSYSFEDAKVRENISPMLKFFSNKQTSSNLNTLYGPLTLPRRSLKHGETDSIQNIQRRTDTLTLVRGSDAKKLHGILKKEVKYIWVIDEMGDIIIGEDINHNDLSFNGHPTLIDGKPARIAGELIYIQDEKKWEINLKSRAYSSHLDKDANSSLHRLNVIKEYNLSGFI